MLTYYEFKEFFYRIMGIRDIEIDNSDIVFDIQSRYSTTAGNGQRQITITDVEFFNLYNKVLSMFSDRIEFYKKDYYEIAIDFDYPMMRNREISAISDDNANGIHYELNLASLEYSAFLLSKLGEEYNNGNRRIPLMRLRRPIDFIRHTDEEEPINLNYLLPRMIGELSLKIKTTDEQSLPKFRKLKNAFIFEFMYLSDMALVEYNNVNEIFRINNSARNRFDISQISTPPLREYTDDVVDYYKLALSSSDPYIGFISFYHVMEYFYDEVFKKKMVEDIKNRITHPDFSYKNDDKLYDMALFIKNRMKMDVESGQGNELESLNFVLREYIVIDDLKTRVNNIDVEAIQYYQTTKVPFCNAPTIGWDDAQGVFTQLAKRIYYTRNSLVHSKSGKNNDRYRSYANEPQLQKEIPLAKAVAEMIIINSSKIL